MSAGPTTGTAAWDHLAAIIESSTDVIITKDANAVITSWNPAAERTYGWTAEEAVGRPISILIPEHRRGEERRILDRILAGERLEEYETERVRKDGEQIVVSLTISPVRDHGGDIVGASVIARDITSRHRSRVLAERIQELTLALAGEVEPTHAVEVLLEQAIRGAEADAATVGVVDRGDETVKLIGSRGHEEEGLEQWQAFPLAAELPMTRAIREGETIWIPSREALSESFPAIPLESIRFDCLAVIPLTVGGRTIGSFSLSFRRTRKFDAELEAFLFAVAEQAAHALERNRLRDAEQRTTRRLAFLAEAGELLAESLDLDVTLSRLADLTVERLADWCAIDLVDPEVGALSNSTVAHKDPARLELAKRLRETYPPDLNADHGLGRVLRTGEPELFEVVPDELLEASAQDEEHLVLIRELGIKSAIIAPLEVRGRRLGAITVISAESGEHYGSAELELVSDLARRAALAIDNSMLFQREHDAAVTLQRSLLPQSLPEIEGLDLAARYEPAAPGLEVGGDWYEVVVRDDGKVGLIIGDVAGRGIRAATVMGRVSQAARAYVLEGHAPAEAVVRLNRVLREAPRPEMVTLLHMIFDPETGEGEYVRAGHPPAVVLKPDGSTELLLGQGTHPLGILESAVAPTNTMRLEPGSLMLLYTDGLIERRDAALDVGLDRLRSALADSPRDAEGCLAWLAERLEADVVPDDVAMLAVRATNGT